jgi:hypothetical protein
MSTSDHGGAQKAIQPVRESGRAIMAQALRVVEPAIEKLAVQLLNDNRSLPFRGLQAGSDRDPQHSKCRAIPVRRSADRNPKRFLCKASEPPFSTYRFGFNQRRRVGEVLRELHRGLAMI